MILICFEDILNGSITVHEIQPNLNDATMSGLEHITNIIAQYSKRFERIHGFRWLKNDCSKNNIIQ